MPKKTGTIKGWVTRDEGRGKSYNISIFQPVAKLGDRWWSMYEPRRGKEFEKHIFKLKPGTRPVPVDITIRRRKK